MSKFVLLSFVFLGWAFYEVSGGSEFEPAEPRRVASLKVVSDAPAVSETSLAPSAKNVALAVPVTKRVAPSPEPAPAATPKPTATPAGAILVSVPIPTPDDEKVQLTPPPSEKSNAAQQASLDPVVDIRSVRSSRVNLRSGPGTGFGIVGKLVRGTRVEVLRDPGAGWIKLKVEETGRIGWMSAKLLSKTN